MVTIRMTYHHINPENVYSFNESFEDESFALSYIVGFIGAHPCNITEMEMETS